MSVGIVDKQTGERIPTAGMPAIDNALDLTSVNPVQNAIITAALANKQDKTDNSLQTTDKTVVGAINEHEGDISSLMSGLIDTNSSVKLNTNDLTTVSRTKNILPITVDKIKEVNTSGTWSGNVYTLNNTTFEILTDENNVNVNGIKINTGSGGASADCVFGFNDEPIDILAQNYTLNGCPLGGSDSTYFLLVQPLNASLQPTTSIIDTGSGVAFTITTETRRIRSSIRILSGCNIENMTFYPMIRLSTETDAAFTPYIQSIDSRVLKLESNIKLPTAPTADGSYTLKVTVASGTPSYSWADDTP